MQFAVPNTAEDLLTAPVVYGEEVEPRLLQLFAFFGAKIGDVGWSVGNKVAKQIAREQKKVTKLPAAHFTQKSMHRRKQIQVSLRLRQQVCLWS